ncbi:MAG: aminotransferase class V-fold PLP-dependent enzyme, partial [Oscillospiraceae bacterium]|nr:aminotransferase class V-fold PLP-dependent enzyme [Oscillospiraceae bacterium]
MSTIYLDNAATSFPKPEGVSAAMKSYMDKVGATINRSVYGSAQDAGLVILQLRQQLKALFHFPEP